MTFHVGQKVVCVDGSPPENQFFDADIAPRTNNIYTICDVGPYKDRLHVSVIEIPVYGRWPNWRASRFRPLISRSANLTARRELFDKWLHTKKEEVDA